MQPYAYKRNIFDMECVKYFGNGFSIELYLNEKNINNIPDDILQHMTKRPYVELLDAFEKESNPNGWSEVINNISTNNI